MKIATWVKVILGKEEDKEKNIRLENKCGNRLLYCNKYKYHQERENDSNYDDDDYTLFSYFSCWSPSQIQRWMHHYFSFHLARSLSLIKHLEFSFSFFFISLETTWEEMQLIQNRNKKDKKETPHPPLKSELFSLRLSLIMPKSLNSKTVPYYYEPSPSSS